MLRNVTRELQRPRQASTHVLPACLASIGMPPRTHPYSISTAHATAPVTVNEREASSQAKRAAHGEQARRSRYSHSDPPTKTRASQRPADGINPSPSESIPISPYVSKQRELATPATNGLQSRPGWTTSHQLRRPVERRTKLVKSWQNQTPNFLLKRVLEIKEDAHEWKAVVATARSMRLPLVLLQMLIREESQLNKDHPMLDLLPDENEWTRVMQIMSGNGHTPEDLSHYLYVLRGSSDDERCRRFLERNAFQPVFLLNFLLRPSSSISQVTTLNALMDYCRTWFAEKEPSSESGLRCQRQVSARPGPKFNIADFRGIAPLLSHHCLRLEPRLIVKLADVTARHIENMVTHTGPVDKIYQMQCRAFNDGLEYLRPQPGMRTAQKVVPNAYIWEAQRILLSMSASFEQPLLVDRDGFRAIRDVLSGLPKNQTEIHSSSRHAATWPPYLRPADGMDETMDPEDNWSRAVRAGTLMQEAGFAKDERDDAVDILQGMTPDGAPTIQQRTLIGKWRKLEAWEASIRATRNAQEAWERFQNPPKPRMKAGPPQFAAMFEKLVLREANAESALLAGDKALNFPTEVEANLAEFERARIRPPSVAQLYRQMRLAGVRPQGNCLRILVANAESLDTAHQYLRESTEDSKAVRSLMSDDPDAHSLKLVGMSLFSAYIQVCSRIEGKRGAKHLRRAIRLTGMRLESERSRWIPFVWGPILKNLSQHHHGLRMSLVEQLNLFLQIVERIDASHGIPLSTFIQFGKCIRKASRRELEQLCTDLAAEETAQRNSLRLLYDWQSREAKEEQKPSTSVADITGKVTLPNQADTKTPLYLLSLGAIRMKQLFKILCSQEKETQRLLQVHNVSAADRMTTRNDPVRSEHAQEYMLSLAYVGEFKEMARVLKWLVEQWGQADIVESLEELGETPAYADFFDTLCIFRLLAEPMLDETTVTSLQEDITAARLQWSWPDDEAVEAYAHMQDDESVMTLRRVLECVRRGQTASS